MEFLRELIVLEPWSCFTAGLTATAAGAVVATRGQGVKLADVRVFEHGGSPTYRRGVNTQQNGVSPLKKTGSCPARWWLRQGRQILGAPPGWEGAERPQRRGDKGMRKIAREMGVGVSVVQRVNLEHSQT